MCLRARKEKANGKDGLSAQAVHSAVGRWRGLLRGWALPGLCHQLGTALNTAVVVDGSAHGFLLLELLKIFF